MNRNNLSNTSLIVIGTAEALAFADTESFDQARPGALPARWECRVTGRGSPHWAVEIDSSAPSNPTCSNKPAAVRFRGASRRPSRSPMVLPK